MKLSQYLYVWFNQSPKKKIECYQCTADLSYDPKQKVPPLVVTRKGHPYCMHCAWRLGIVQKIGVVQHA